MSKINDPAALVPSTVWDPGGVPSWTIGADGGMLPGLSRYWNRFQLPLTQIQPGRPRGEFNNPATFASVARPLPRAFWQIGNGLPTTMDKTLVRFFASVVLFLVFLRRKNHAPLLPDPTPLPLLGKVVSEFGNREDGTAFEVCGRTGSDGF